MYTWGGFVIATCHRDLGKWITTIGKTNACYEEFLSANLDRFPYDSLGSKLRNFRYQDDRGVGSNRLLERKRHRNIDGTQVGCANRSKVNGHRLDGVRIG